jgi:hypothetical protein
MDRGIDVLAVHVGDEALIERVYDEGAMPSRCGCDPALQFPPMSSVFFCHSYKIPGPFLCRVIIKLRARMHQRAGAPFLQ